MHMRVREENVGSVLPCMLDHMAPWLCDSHHKWHHRWHITTTARQDIRCDHDQSTCPRQAIRCSCPSSIIELKASPGSRWHRLPLRQHPQRSQKRSKKLILVLNVTDTMHLYSSCLLDTEFTYLYAGTENALSFFPRNIHCVFD